MPLVRGMTAAVSVFTWMGAACTGARASGGCGGSVVRGSSNPCAAGCALKPRASASLVSAHTRRFPHATHQGRGSGVPGRQAGRRHRRLQEPKDHGSNVVYKRLRERGYEVFAVNPNADEVEGDRCYPDLSAIPGGVDGVVIGTRPERAEGTMRECADLGIKHVWMHRGPGPRERLGGGGRYGREHGIAVIDGGCPCMFGPTADPGHKAMRTVLTLTGNVPRRV